MKALVKRFIKEEKGLETVEWAVMAALIVLGIVGAVITLQDEMNNVFGGLVTEMQNAQP